MPFVQHDLMDKQLDELSKSMWCALKVFSILKFQKVCLMTHTETRSEVDPNQINQIKSNYNTPIGIGIGRIVKILHSGLGSGLCDPGSGICVQ